MIKKTAAKDSRVVYFIKRVFAFMVDWYLTAVLSYLLFNLINSLILKDKMIKDTNSLLFILCTFLATCFTFVYIPLKRAKNQTIMQKVLHLELVALDGSKLKVRAYLIRFLIGSLLLESAFYLLSEKTINYLMKVFINKNEQSYIAYFLVALSLIGILSALLDKRNNQTFHDRISGSKVISSSFLDKGNKLL